MRNIQTIIGFLCGIMAAYLWYADGHYVVAIAVAFLVLLNLTVFSYGGRG